MPAGTDIPNPISVTTSSFMTFLPPEMDSSEQIVNHFIGVHTTAPKKGTPNARDKGGIGLQSNNANWHISNVRVNISQTQNRLLFIV
jgi:hypothetical protein